MRKTAKPYFITLEGIEGSGKTTQLANIIDYLDHRGLAAVSTREPGGTEIADKIRHLLVESHGEPVDPLAELFLYDAARVQHLLHVIRPALAKGKIVVCDRFTDSTIAYQHYGRGLDLGMVTQVNSWATNGLKPDLTYYLDCEPEIGLARSRERLNKDASPENRFEAESLDFHTRVRTGFLELAQRQKNRFVVIDASQNPEEVHDAIVVDLDRRFG
jgi:dTMP kinase